MKPGDRSQLLANLDPIGETTTINGRYWKIDGTPTDDDLHKPIIDKIWLDKREKNSLDKGESPIKNVTCGSFSRPVKEDTGDVVTYYTFDRFGKMVKAVAYIPDTKFKTPDNYQVEKIAKMKVAPEQPAIPTVNTNKLNDAIQRSFCATFDPSLDVKG